MHNFGMIKMKKSIACIIAIMILFIVVLYSFFIVHEANHDCTGEDCPVCACIMQCENTFIGFGGIFVVPLMYICRAYIAIVVRAIVCFVIPDTPVLRKVRMNN